MATVEVTVLSISAIGCGVLPPAFGMGCAITYSCLWYFWWDLNALKLDCSQLQLLSSVSLLNLVTYGGAVVHWYDQIQWKNAIFLTLFQLPGSILGVILVYEYGRDIWFTRAMGIVYLTALFSFVLRECVATTYKEAIDFNQIFDDKKIAWVTMMTCLASGLLAGLTGAGAPPFVIYTLFFNFRRETFIGTYKVSRTFITIAVLIQLSIGTPTMDSWRNDMIGVYIGTVVGGWIGLLLGYFLSDKVEQRVFSNVLRALLLISGTLAVTEGLRDARIYIIAGVATLTMLYFASPSWCFWKRNYRLEHQILNSTIQTGGGTFDRKSSKKDSIKDDSSNSYSIKSGGSHTKSQYVPSITKSYAPSAAASHAHSITVNSVTHKTREFYEKNPSTYENSTSFYFPG